MNSEGTLVLTQSAIGEINFGDAAASDHRQRSEASGVKNEGTLVLTQSAIGEINLATELQAIIGNARRLPV